MLTEFQEKWLQALESGEYTQGRGELRSATNSYCCLGVACDLYDSNAWVKINNWWYYDYSSDLIEPETGVGSTLRLRDKMAKVLAVKNDSGHTFTEIAAYIRAHESEVFDN